MHIRARSRTRSVATGYAVVTTVLPLYRQAFVELLGHRLDVVFFTGSEHSEASVRTNIDNDRVVVLHNVFLLGRRLIVQRLPLLHLMKCEAVVAEMNPRILSTWLLLVLRRCVGRRTVLWGHLDSRAGAGSRSGWLRRRMLRTANGVLLYTYAEQGRAAEDFAATWVAPNALYKSADIKAAPLDPQSSPCDVIYVGRLVDEKRVDLLVRAFTRFRTQHPQAGVQAQLVIVGSGPAEPRLRSLVSELGVSGRAVFRGEVADAATLRELYSTCFASVSPGYVGLSLTQSLGFGVPMIIAEGEPHAPEIELSEIAGSSTFFENGSVDSLAEALTRAWDSRKPTDASRMALSNAIRDRYSAEAMTEGFVSALTSGSSP